MFGRFSRSNRARRQAMLAVAAGAAGLAAANLAYATNYTWVNAGVSNNWSSADNWTKGDGTHEVPPQSPPTGDTTDLIFSGAYAANAVSTQNIGSINVDSIRINATFTGTATLNISGSSTGDQYIYLGAGGIISEAVGTIVLNSGINRRLVLTADQTWSNSNTSQIFSQRRAIDGAFKVTKAGAGTIELQGENSNFTGGLSIDEGWIRLSAVNTALGAGTVTSDTAKDTGISASGSTQVDQNINGVLTLGGTGTFTLGGSWNFAINNTVTLTSSKNLSISHIATFSSAITGAGFVMNKLGGGTAVLQAASSHGGFNILSGTVQASDDAQLGAAGAALGLGDSDATPPGGRLQAMAPLNSSARAINLDATGGIIDTNGFDSSFAAVAGGGTLTKEGAGQLTLKSVHAGGLAITVGSVKIAPDGGNTSVVQNLELAGGVTPTVALDLSDNDLIVDYDATNPLATVTAQVVAGRAAGAWNGLGIRSSSAAADTSKALGVGDNAVLNKVTFSGETVDASAVLVKYTWLGDSNLDGQVDITDLAALATAWQTAGAWVNGDFDYSGFIDITDLAALATNWQAGVGAPLGQSFEQALASVGLGAIVPEPVSVGLLGLGAILARRRRG